MNLTNKHNLPEPLVRAVESDSYDPGHADYTPTSLLRPARMAQLMADHAGETTEDVADRIYALDGQADHYIIERAANKLENWITEERFYFDVPFGGGKRTIGAQIDLYDRDTNWLIDYKRTSAYTIKGYVAGEKNDWPIQLSIGRLGLMEAGLSVRRMSVVARCRDWSRATAQKDELFAKKNNFLPRYPQHPVQVIDFDPVKDIEQWIIQRIEAHEGPLPYCSPEERWQTPEKWATHKTKARALKLYDNPADAHEHAEKIGGWVDHRPGTPNRCANYCAASEFCSQYQEELRGV
jgi:hypothetical protein